MSNSAEVINPESFRTTGENVRKFNIHAVSLIKSIIRSTFGPLGNEKIYIDIIGESTYTKDGATFLRKIDVQHPGAKVLIDATNTVDNEVGDGTLTTAILSATLIEKAGEMMEDGISPATISSGFDNGLRYALEALDTISRKVDNKDRIIIEKLIQTCLETKIIFSSKDQIEMKNILNVTTKAINAIYSDNNSIEVDDIKIEEKIGNLMDSQFVDGIIIDKSIDNKSMPKFIDNARILLLDEELESRTTRTESQITANSPNQMMLFRNVEKEIVRNKIQHIIDSGANVIISRKGIDSLAQQILSSSGIMSIKRVKENDLYWLEKATGGRIIKDLEDKEIIKGNLGFAKRVSEKTISDDRMIFVEGCSSPKSVTILIRASSKMIMDECHRAIQSALLLVKRFIQSPYIVIGGGSCEMLMAHHIRKKADLTSGIEQIVLKKFAESLEEITLTLARNCGLDVLDSEIKLRTHLSEKRPSEGINWIGVNSFERKIGYLNWDVIESGVAKEQILNSAVEVSRLLVNVDDIIVKKILMNTHTHEDGTEHSHAGGDKKHDHYFDKLGKQQRPHHHHY
ncbi:MAG TPA: thermosome subunit alpha [Candidatus Saccharimonadales bacterium]|nr:thermosome subunit alpha [Candidatus Saccharimonadales bacterium]